MLRVACCVGSFLVIAGIWVAYGAAEENEKVIPTSGKRTPTETQNQATRLTDPPPVPTPLIRPARAPRPANAPSTRPETGSTDGSQQADGSTDRQVFDSKPSQPVAVLPKDLTPSDEGTSPNGLTPEVQALKKRVQDTLALYSTKHLNTRDNTPWEVMHSFVAYNIPTTIGRDGPNGQQVNAIGWLLWGGRCQGQPILTLRNGRPYALQGPGVQGHPAQLLAILAQSRVSAKTPMQLEGKQFTLQDLIEEEKLDCRPNSELTFKLISMAHYLPSDATWKSRDGQEWSIPRLISEEIRQPIRGAACGGTHRLFGLSYAYKMRQKRGDPVTGEYLRAQKYIEDYHRYTRTLQNPDGSFSTEWFARRGDRPDMDRKVQTTGHILEWLVFSMNDEQLREPMVVNAVDFLSRTLLQNPNHSWSIGPLGHALHALMMYDERVFQRPRYMPTPVETARRADAEAETAEEVAEKAGEKVDGPALSQEVSSPALAPADGSGPQLKAAFRPEEAVPAEEGPQLTFPR